MTEEEAKQAFEELRKEGASDDDIIASLGKMYENDEITKNQLGALVDLMGYSLNEDFAKMSDEEAKKNLWEEEEKDLPEEAEDLPKEDYDEAPEDDGGDETPAEEEEDEDDDDEAEESEAEEDEDEEPSEAEADDDDDEETAAMRLMGLK